MNDESIKQLAETAGFSWLTMTDYLPELRRFAQLVSAEQRERSARLCEEHAVEPKIMLVTQITDKEREIITRECAALVRSGS